MPQASRRDNRATLENMEERSSGRNESGGLLNTIDKSLDDMRTIVTCRVCVRPLYEPFTVECGHTFCYTCLVSWFEKNAANKTCPDCRAKITRKPAPAYLIREITQLFSNRAELLPSGETTQEHQVQQREEAKVLEEDRRGRGVFRGCFRREERRVVDLSREAHVIIDDEDGVNRCPRCAWEVEDGECASCGWPEEVMDEDTTHSETSDENGMELVDRYLAGEPHHHHSPSSDLDATNESDDVDDLDESDDESVGSLNEFVVQDEGPQHLPHGPRLTRRQLEWRFPSRDGRAYASSEDTDAGPLTHFGRNSDPGRQSEIDVDSPSEYPSNLSSAEELHTDELSQLDSPGLRYVDGAGNVQYIRDPHRVRGYPTVVQISDDEDIVPFTPRARNNRRLRSNQVNTISDSGSQSRSPQVLEVSSDSDETDVLGSNPPHRNRMEAANGSLIEGRYNDPRRTGYLRDLISTEINIDGSDEDARRNVVHARLDEDDPSLIEVGDSEDAPVSEAQRTSHSRLDPTTSIPVRRENVNMPGAFPPSFVSEQGQSQSAPSTNPQDVNDGSYPRRGLVSRRAHQNRGHDSTFHDRRRHEERSYSRQGEDSRRRDRSAAKSARRQDRQRVKATQQARGRRNGEPSVPPSTS